MVFTIIVPFKRDKTPLQTQTPMTLAETASIMCETIVFKRALLADIDDPKAEAKPSRDVHFKRRPDNCRISILVSS